MAETLKIIEVIYYYLTTYTLFYLVFLLFTIKMSSIIFCCKRVVTLNKGQECLFKFISTFALFFIKNGLLYL